MVGPQSTSYVSRRRMDEADFDPDETDSEGLPLVYNEAKIAEFWRSRPRELATRWAKFGRISGASPLLFMYFMAIRWHCCRRRLPLCCTAVSALHMHG